MGADEPGRLGEEAADRRGRAGARMVSYPFTVRDICLVTDGGGAIVITSAERANSLKKPPVYVLGSGSASPTPTSRACRTSR